MQIGISTASFFTKVATEDTFDYLKSFNSEVCEVFLSSFSEYEGELADKIVHNKSVDVYSVHTLTNQYFLHPYISQSLQKSGLSLLET